MDEVFPWCISFVETSEKPCLLSVSASLSFYLMHVWMPTFTWDNKVVNHFCVLFMLVLVKAMQMHIEECSKLGLCVFCQWGP